MILCIPDLLIVLSSKEAPGTVYIHINTVYKYIHFLGEGRGRERTRTLFLVLTLPLGPINILGVTIPAYSGVAIPLFGREMIFSSRPGSRLALLVVQFLLVMRTQVVRISSNK